VRNIKARITSEDIDVLEQSLRFVRDRAAQEADRGKTAEARATAMLALLGILAGFIVPLIQTVATAAGETKWSLLVAFLASLIFLVKGLYHAVRVLGVSKRYRLEVESVYDFQALARVDALRDEIAGLVWECNRAIQPNTEKLFWLHRCQRSGLIAIVLFMLFGILLLSATEKWVSLPQWVAFVLAGGAVLLLALSDPVAERLGIWGCGNHTASVKKPKMNQGRRAE
jgi:hypothetical protein